MKLNPGNFWDISISTPWKLKDEILMYLIKPFVYLYIIVNGVKIGRGSKFYGFPKIFRHSGSKIIIGNNFEARSWRYSNPLGVNHPLILSTWKAGAQIVIGDDVGITGGTIVASDTIRIGNRTLIGANSTIIDSNFHPTRGIKRYSKANIAIKPVDIGDDVFIGMNSIILLGADLPNETIVPAGGVIR